MHTKFKLPNGNETSDSKFIAEKFNEFFINIGPTLAKCIPDINKSPLHHMGNKLKETLFLSPVDIPEIKKNHNVTEKLSSWFWWYWCNFAEIYYTMYCSAVMLCV